MASSYSEYEWKESSSERDGGNESATDDELEGSSEKVGGIECASDGEFEWEESSSTEEDGSCDDAELNESFFLGDSDDDTSDNITSKTAMPNQKLNVGEEYERPLYPGSQISILMTYLLVFQFSIRHSLTESALKELLLLISVLLPVQASFPKSVQKLKHFFSEAFPKLMPTFQEYCSSCHKLLEQGKSCTECQTTKSAMFIAVPIGSQIESKLQGQFSCTYCYYGHHACGNFI